MEKTRNHDFEFDGLSKITNEGYKELLSKFVKNIVVGPGLYKSYKSEIDRGEDIFSEHDTLIVASGEITGFAGIFAMYNHNLFNEFPSSWGSIMVATAGAIFLTGMNPIYGCPAIWGPIYGVIDRMRRAYRFSRDIVDYIKEHK